MHFFLWKQPALYYIPINCMSVSKSELPFVFPVLTSHFMPTLHQSMAAWVASSFAWLHHSAV
jgi:hypothetical protein